jgi:hypothetical protein
MRQLVGQNCAVCGNRIGSVVDGRFCEGCGNPVHDNCSKPAPEPVSNDELLSVADQQFCPRCGAIPQTVVAVEVRNERLAHRAAAEIAPLADAARPYRTWRAVSRLFGLFGVVIILHGILNLKLPPDPASPATPAEMRAIGRLAIIGGTVLVTVGLVFGWLKWNAGQRFRRVLAGEEEEPPG